MAERGCIVIKISLGHDGLIPSALILSYCSDGLLPRRTTECLTKDREKSQSVPADKFGTAKLTGSWLSGICMND